MYTALKARIPFLDINQEREFGYEGYQGMLELVRQLALTLESPVWTSVRKQAPWKMVKSSNSVGYASRTTSSDEEPESLQMPHSAVEPDMVRGAYPTLG
jgi:nitrogenase molybdenum-cofactor synthesis protein NifE